MFPEKTFQVALLISVAIHGAVILQASYFNIAPFRKARQQNIRVNYMRSREEAPPLPKNKPQETEPLRKASSKLMLQKVAPPPFTAQETNPKMAKRDAMQDLGFAKPSLLKSDIIPIRRKVSLPAVGVDKNSSATYISYYQIVREKIRRAAYQNYTHTEEGEVYLSFIVSSEGQLQEVRLVEEKSSSNPYLRETALVSIKDASPFPKFPKELDYPQLSFNIVISFEIE